MKISKIPVHLQRDLVTCEMHPRKNLEPACHRYPKVERTHKLAHKNFLLSRKTEENKNHAMHNKAYNVFNILFY